MRILVVGADAIGGYFGGRLLQAGCPQSAGGRGLDSGRARRMSSNCRGCRACTATRIPRPGSIDDDRRGLTAGRFDAARRAGRRRDRGRSDHRRSAESPKRAGPCRAAAEHCLYALEGLRSPAPADAPSGNLTGGMTALARHMIWLTTPPSTRVAAPDVPDDPAPQRYTARFATSLVEVKRLISEVGR